MALSAISLSVASMRALRRLNHKDQLCAFKMDTSSSVLEWHQTSSSLSKCTLAQTRLTLPIKSLVQFCPQNVTQYLQPSYANRFRNKQKRCKVLLQIGESGLPARIEKIMLITSYTPKQQVMAHSSQVGDLSYRIDNSRQFTQSIYMATLMLMPLLVTKHLPVPSRAQRTKHSLVKMFLTRVKHIPWLIHKEPQSCQ